jgi:hypothetical protein
MIKSEKPIEMSKLTRFHFKGKWRYLDLFKRMQDEGGIAHNVFE